MTIPQILTAVFVGLGLLALASLWFARRQPPPNWIVVDGSNVLYWNDNRPELASVTLVLRALESLGYTPVIWFDANVGFLVAKRFMKEPELASLLALRPGRVFLAGKGTPADPWMLAQARDLKARIVTNDRFRDWAEAHPEVAEPGHLIHGRLRGDTVLLDMPRS